MENNEIEIRSKSLQNFIREIPPRLVRMGNFIILCIITALTLIVCTLHYPYDIECKGVVGTYMNTKGTQTKGIAYLNIPYKYSYLFEEKRIARLSFEGDLEHTYDYEIKDIRYTPIKIGGENYFTAITEVTFPHPMQGEINCSATILVENCTLWQSVFH